MLKQIRVTSRVVVSEGDESKTIGKREYIDKRIGNIIKMVSIHS